MIVDQTMEEDSSVLRRSRHVDYPIEQIAAKDLPTVDARAVGGRDRDHELRRTD